MTFHVSCSCTDTSAPESAVTRATTDAGSVAASENATFAVLPSPFATAAFAAWPAAFSSGSAAVSNAWPTGAPDCRSSRP